MSKALLAASAVFVALSMFAQAFAQETKIVGSSTVSPFAYLARDHMGAQGKAITIDATGTGGGFAFFCKSLDPQFAPVTLASRPISEVELNNCRLNRVGEIKGYNLGLSGVVVVQKRRKKPVDITALDLFLALAAKTPVRFGGECELVDNPHMTWSDIRAGLPDWPIQVYGPPHTSGTRSAFVKLAIKVGALELDCMRALKRNDPKAFEKLIAQVRTDSAWIDAGENDNVLLAAVKAMPKTFGVVGYPLYQKHSDKLTATSISGVSPTPKAISEGEYPLSRVLRVYAKEQALENNPIALAFIEAITGEDANGAEGYLTNAGLIPLAGGSPQDPIACGVDEMCFFKH